MKSSYRPVIYFLLLEMTFAILPEQYTRYNLPQMKLFWESKEIRTIMRNAINRVAPYYGYKSCEDSTRVLTIKKVSPPTSRIIHSCDFAIVHNCTDGRQQYIRFNKDNDYYSWEYQGKGFADLDKKIDWLKKNGLWTALKEYYIEKKNLNENPDKHSRSIFAESINEMCQKNGCRK